MTPEGLIQHEILRTWGAHPRMRLARMNVGRVKIGNRYVRFGIPGLADICGILAPWGRLLMIEVKSATGVQSRAQKVMQRVVTAFGGLYVLARSLDDVDRAFATLGITR